MAKPSSYSTMTMVICLIYSMSKWISTYFELLLNIGILPIATSLLGRFAGFDLGTSGYEEKMRRLHLEYLRVGHLPQSTRAYR
ncbi:hypothetical protein Goshw_008006 [Gossypium schwendimanii]|uniref:Uncharacterized protein n=2 Tax=Gossypium schwendimanii TaxID=34291 RepID=A0A7J9N847_GOSSC|nr:hypothetical protein [Gossypium schwendimanii]